MDVQALLNGFTQFAQLFIPFLLTGLAVLMGLYIIYKGISDIYKKGSGRQSGGQEATYGGIALKFLVGGLMLRLGATMEDISMLVIGTGIQDYRGVLAYAPLPAQAGLWRQVFEVCLLWVVMLGWAGAFKGLLLWSKASDGGGGGGSAGDLFWQGTWHLLGAAGAINLTGLIQSFLGT